jgi:hypothetical protein
MINTSSACIKRNLPATTKESVPYGSVSFYFHLGSIILMFSIYEATEAPESPQILISINHLQFSSPCHCLLSCIPEYLYLSLPKDIFIISFHPYFRLSLSRTRSSSQVNGFVVTDLAKVVNVNRNYERKCFFSLQ